MLPRLSRHQTLQPQYLAFLEALSSVFDGDIDTRYSARIVQATDNSVYQFLPQAVVYPRSTEDVQQLMRLAAKEEFSELVFSARGGGTGTNAQSLTHGLIIDVSRYMTSVLEVNAEEGWARVQAGVVKDALNDALRPFGFFFSPDLSTSNRATLGGMINTDASGAGSLVYGKTSDHVLGLKSVLIDGSVLDTSPLATDQLDNVSRDTLGGRIIRNIASLCRQKRPQVKARFPRLNRFLTGYDLEHVWNDELTHFDLSRILAGSEGTLAVITEAKLSLTPLPAHRAMVNIKYDSFESALRHAPSLVDARATVVETLDSKVLGLAREDIVWHSVRELIRDLPGKGIEGINMVEFAGSHGQVSARVAALEAMLERQIAAGNGGVLGFQTTQDIDSIEKIYAMRKKAVGLLGATKGSRKPIAFAEDTAVPPEKLADFILEFRALLDAHHLQYGMFGHVDAGVLHVRPALDMCDPADEKLLRRLSDEVAALTMKYGGLMWGEHGKGVRGEYAPAFFGEELYGVLQDIKGWFDPDNRLNPGKLVAPRNKGALRYNVDSVKRGTFDRQISPGVRQAFPSVMNCNGNGLCFNYASTSPMCPSFKATGDRIQSPKGRASLMREWLRLVEAEGIDMAVLSKSKPLGILSRTQHTILAKSEYDFSHEVMASLQGCLACKACASQCPVKVDVPAFRAQFYDIYYRRYLRPPRDYLVAGIEETLPQMAKAPKLANALTHNVLSKWVIKKFIGYVDTPKLSVPTLVERLISHSCLEYDLASLKKLPEEERSNYVLVVQDPFNTFYDASLVYKFILLIEKLGFKPVLLPFKPNGKPAHIKGFLEKFAATAGSAASFFNELACLNIPMVGIDPALVLVYRDEYRAALGQDLAAFDILLVNEWLMMVLAHRPMSEVCDHRFTWFSHCTESTARPGSADEWRTIFGKFGATLAVKNLGCCGMAGTYGHELEHLSQSRTLFDLSWREPLERLPRQEILVSGYSCRTQVNRFAGFRPKHPLEALLDLI